MAAKFRGGRSRRALIALALPLAALVPLAVPVDAAPAGLPAGLASSLTGLGAAAAATVSKTMQHQVTATRPATTRRVCTTR